MYEDFYESLLRVDQNWRNKKITIRNVNIVLFSW